MTDPHNDTADIAWLRNLAAEGAATPMRGSAILLAAGLIFGAASVFHWSVASGLVDAGPLFSTVWLGATALFLIVVVVVNLRVRKDCAVTTTANRGAGAAWSGVGWAIFALFASLAIIGSRMGGEAALMLFSLIPSAIMVFYGMGWAVTAALQKSRPLGLLAIASFVAAPLLALLSGTAEQFLAYGGCLFALMALPGFLLMRAANRG